MRTVDKTDFPKMEAQARASGDRVSSSMRRVGEQAGGFLVAQMTAKLAEFATRGIDFVLGGIDLASSFNESLSKVRTIFGDSSSEIEAWAETAADSIGLAEGAALDAAGTFGNLFDQLGFASAATADMSTEMIDLAADFASFHNADITEVIAAQTAAFRGEYDALQRFVPTINAAAVEQQALAMTGKQATSELTAQEKALATYTFMVENAGAATGDFARTADSSANAQRRAQAAMTDLQTELGQRLLPVMDAVTQAQLAMADAGERYLLPALDRVGQFISDHEAQFRALGDVLSDVADVIGDQLSGMLDQLDISAVEALAIALGTLLAGAAVVLGVAVAGAAASLVPLMIALHGVVTVVGAAKKAIEVIGDAIEDIRDKVPGAATGLDLLGDALGTVAGHAETLFGVFRSSIDDTNAWVEAIQGAIDGISVDPDTLNSLTQFADSALVGIEADAAAAAASVEELEAELEELSAQIAEMAGVYDGTAIFRRIEDEAASLAAQAQELTGDVFSLQFGFDRTTEAGRNLEAGFEGIHEEVLTMAERFVNGEATADQLTAAQNRAREVLGGVADQMGATAEEADYLSSHYSALPEDVQTRVDMVGNAKAELANVASKIGSLPSSHSITVSVLGNAIASLNNIAGAVGRVPRGIGITRRASGGATSGLTLVGEDGPELLDAPPGSFVHSGPASGALRAQGGGGTTIINNLYFAGSLRSDREVEEIVANLNRRGGSR